MQFNIQWEMLSWYRHFFDLKLPTIISRFRGAESFINASIIRDSISQFSFTRHEKNAHGKPFLIGILVCILQLEQLVRWIH